MESTLNKAKTISVPALFQEAKVYVDSRVKGEEELDLEDLEGSWENASKLKYRHRDFSAHIEDWRSQKPMSEVLMAEIQVENPWEVLAHFEYRIWYESPRLKEHCAIWRHWYETCDAHIVSVTHQHIEAKAYKPPATKEQAIELAWEHYYYCPDVVDHIADTAFRLINGDSWYFWWD